MFPHNDAECAIEELGERWVSQAKKLKDQDEKCRDGQSVNRGFARKDQDPQRNNQSR